MTKKRQINTTPWLSKPSKMKTQVSAPHVTTLHGISMFSALKGRNRLLWSLLMIYNVILTFLFLAIIRERFNSDQIVTKLHSDWTVDKVPFPAVSICNFNDVSLNESRKIQKILQESKIPANEIESFLRDLSFLTHYGWGSDKISSHLDIMKVLKQYFYSVSTVMEEVRQKCENLLVYCDFNGIEKNCADLFTLVSTSQGFCCTFNYEGVESPGDDYTISKDVEFEKYYDQNSKTRTNLIATSQAGRASGLRVIFTVEPGDYPPWSNAPAFGAKILLSDPNDFIETTVLRKSMMSGEAVDLKVEPLIFTCEDGVRSIPIEKRACGFVDEVHLVHTNKYSYETCNTECRIMNYNRFCGCIPYKYPSDKSSRICEFSDLKCLHYMKVHWDRVKEKCTPECLKECRDKQYTFSDDTVPFLADSYPDTVTKDRDASSLSSVHVYYLQSTCTGYKMTLLTDTNTFIATYGGIFSLAFGASMMTIFELIYLSLASLIKIIRQRARSNNIEFRN